MASATQMADGAAAVLASMHEDRFKITGWCDNPESVVIGNDDGTCSLPNTVKTATSHIIISWSFAPSKQQQADILSKFLGPRLTGAPLEQLGIGVAC